MEVQFAVLCEIVYSVSRDNAKNYTLALYDNERIIKCSNS